MSLQCLPGLFTACQTAQHRKWVQLSHLLPSPGQRGQRELPRAPADGQSQSGLQSSAAHRVRTSRWVRTAQGATCCGELHGTLAGAGCSQQQVHSMGLYFN